MIWDSKYLFTSDEFDSSMPVEIKTIIKVANNYELGISSWAAGEAH